MKKSLTNEQFDALAELLRLRDSVSCRAARMAYVEGLDVGEAARRCDTSYNAAHQACKRIQRGLALARAATR